MSTRSLALTALLVLAAGARAQDARTEEPREERKPTVAYVGRVLDADRRPVAGARVWADNGGSYQSMATEYGPAWRFFVPDPDARADVGPYAVRAAEPSGEDGRFRVDGVAEPVGEGFVVVSHPDHVARTHAAKDATAVRGVVDVGDVVLERGAAMRVRVSGPDGKAAQGAWVVARPAERPASERDVVWTEEGPGEVRAARTGNDGIATLRGLRAIRYDVAAFTGASSVTVMTAEAGSTEVAATLRSGATVQVVVVERGGETPVARAKVLVDPVNDSGAWSFPQPVALANLRTDERGIATADGLPPDIDEFQVTVVPPDFADDRIHHPPPFHVAVRVKAGATARVALDAPIAIGLAVSDARSGALLDGVRAVARPEWEHYDRTGGAAVDVTGTRDGEVVLFRRLRAGPWTFDVWAPGHMPARVGPVDVRHTYQAIEAVRLEPCTAVVTGRVVERTSGKAVAGAVVESYEWMHVFLDGQRSRAESGTHGAFRLERLLGRDATLNVTVRAPGYVTERREWDVAGRPSDLGEFRLLRAATIRGRLTDADGRPLAQHRVDLVAYGSERGGKGDGWTATTDAEGRFAFNELRPGQYVVSGQRESSTIRLEEGETFVRDVVR